jgi:glycosyl transferase family 25
MRVYVINLDRSPERLDHMKDQLGRIGIPFVRVAAVDATLMTKEEIGEFRSSVFKAYRSHPWEAAQIGIFLSHQKVWARIASGNDDFSAVFEDDVHLSDRIATLLTNSEWIDRSMDIVRFETTQQAMKLGSVPVSEIDHMKVFKLRSSAWGTAGYVIRRDVARWLDCSPRRIYEPVDWFLFHPKSALSPGLGVFQLDPAPCVQDQYHPILSCRRNFSKVTLDVKSGTCPFKMASRRILSPLVRKATGRRAVPFA